MREKDITGRLKDLSELARDRGFPQEIKIGDWVNAKDGLVLISDYIYEDLDEGEFALEDPVLILEFRHCLAWFEKEGWELRSIARGVHPNEGQFCITVRKAGALTYEDKNSRAAFGPTLNEAGAWLMINIMEGKE